MLSTTLILSLPLITLAAPIASDLKPWEISTLSTHSPSGRSGNAPYSSLFVTITDPNTIPLGKTRYGEAAFPPSAANCTARWNSYAGEDPFGQIIPCEVENFNSGRWTMEIQKANATGNGASATRDFKLRFGLEESMILDEGIVSKRFVGTGGFAVGENLGIVCGGSGVCSTWLKEEGRPWLVGQEVRDTRCLVGVCQGV